MLSLVIYVDVDTGTALTFVLSGIWAQMRLEAKTNCFSVAKLLLLKEGSCHYQKSSFPDSILSSFFFSFCRPLKQKSQDLQEGCLGYKQKFATGSSPFGTALPVYSPSMARGNLSAPLTVFSGKAAARYVSHTICIFVFLMKDTEYI